jgi:hypothetical protein
MRKFFMGERTTGGKVGEANGCFRSVKMPHKLFTLFLCNSRSCADTAHDARLSDPAPVTSS